MLDWVSPVRLIRLFTVIFVAVLILKNLVSMARIELALHAPKARVIPFHYTEKKLEQSLRFPRRYWVDPNTVNIRLHNLERSERIELSTTDWKSVVLPLN